METKFNEYITELTTTTSDNDSMIVSTERPDEIKEEVVVWAILDGILLVAILSGNILTILAVRYSRRLRSVISNQFVLSLAISDILVGLTLPYHLAFYLSTELGDSKHACLLRFFLVIMACCVSIWNLIAIALDRYIAICYPLHYSRYMTRKIALCLMSSGWIVGFTIAAIPLVWNKWDDALDCEFDQIFYPWYMVGVICPVFSLVWFTMFFVYCRIWREASKQVKQLRITGQQEGLSDWKSVQMVLLILGCFTICWLPYFIVACSQIYKITENSSAVAYMAAFTLAMSNSAMNPLIYAWKNSNFRQAFTNLLKCKSPDTLEPSQSMRSNLHRKSSSAQHQESISGAFPNYSTPPFAKKIEPITSMGITFEEDEDKISTHETVSATKTKNNSATPVTIKIESDTRRNSIIISTTTLPSSHIITMQDDPSSDIATAVTSSINSGGGGHHSIGTLDAIMAEVKQQISLEQKQQQRHNCIDTNGTIKSGNLIVNKLTENYGYDGEEIKKFKENLLNVNGISESSRRKSKSATSIAITKHPSKSVSHGSIYDSNLKGFQDSANNEITSKLSNGNICKDLSPSKNLLTTFQFGKRFISKSFNSAVDGGMEKCNNSSEKFHPKSTELYHPA